MPGVDARIGIDKKQNSTARGARTGIARGPNLAAVDRHNLHTGSYSDLRRGIGGRVVDDDNLVLLDLFRRRANGRDGRWQLQFFIIRWNDKRDHQQTTVAAAAGSRKVFEMHAKPFGVSLPL